MNQLLFVDKVTFWIFWGFWPLWLVWELVLLKMRGQNSSVDLISMVARDRTYQFTSLAFIWGSMAAHYWANWKVLPWANAVPAVTFWLLIVACLIWDWRLWNTPYSDLSFWVRVVRFPGIMLFLGLLNGFLLFPQKGPPSQPF